MIEQVYTVGPLPESVYEDEVMWKSYFQTTVERAGGEVVGVPTIVKRTEAVGWTDGDGVYHPPMTACFVSGRARAPEAMTH